MKRLLTLLILLLGLLLPLAAAAKGTVPDAADAMATQMDRQILARMGTETTPRSAITIMCTVPVNLSDLDASGPLGRQMSEEIARWFVDAGYRVQELRKGNQIVFDAVTGETLLTRNVNKLATRDVSSVAILTGTYTVTAQSIRYNMRLIHTPTNEVLAMSTATVPMTEEVRPLVADLREGPKPVAPSVGTKLR